MATLQQFREWLKMQPSSLSDAQLQALIDGETAGQASVCVLPLTEDPPADLVLALYMRVARSAQRKGVPLGSIQGGGDGGNGSARAASFDSDIERLEAPHRRLTAG